MQLTLLDANGKPTGATATTDANGFYQFANLLPGTYGVAETQPAGYYDGLDAAGTAGGTAHNPGDLIDGIPLASGVQAKDYNFGELLPASISGQVYADMNSNAARRRRAAVGRRDDLPAGRLRQPHRLDHHRRQRQVRLHRFEARRLRRRRNPAGRLPGRRNQVGSAGGDVERA